MRQLGVSIYPDQTDIADDKKYLDLAHKYGFTRVFTSLLQLVGDDGADILGQFKETVAYANSLNFKVVVDINPDLFQSLNIKYDDLLFFSDLGVWGLRLDEGFTGLEEAQMTRNPYGLKIELNISAGTNYVDRIMAGGNAKGAAFAAIKAAKEGHFEESHAKLKESDGFMVDAHNAQTAMLTAEARGDHTEVSLLMFHAQDHIMNAITFRDLAGEIV